MSATSVCYGLFRVNSSQFPIWNERAVVWVSEGCGRVVVSFLRDAVDVDLFRKLWPDDQCLQVILTKERHHEGSTGGARCTIDADLALGPTNGPC